MNRLAPARWAAQFVTRMAIVLAAWILITLPLSL